MSTSKKNGLTLGSSRRFDVPPVMVGDSEMTLFHDGKEIVPSSMIVFLNAADPGATRKMKFFCKKNALGWKHLELNAFVIAGYMGTCLQLTDQTYVREWHWDKDATIMGLRSTIAPAKREVQKVYVQEVISNGPSIVDAVDVVADDLVVGNSTRVHGCEVRDLIESRKAAEKRKEDEEFYAQFGLKPPTN
jgi:hypothetical protein